MLKEKLDDVFVVSEGESLDDDTVNTKLYHIIKQLSSEDAYQLIDEAIEYLLQLRDSESISYMLEFISSLYGIAGTNELTDLHELKASVIDRQVEVYGNQFAHNVLDNLNRELGIAK
ncbi:hypothetical protein [Macrococcoides caseolyticum]|uniref:hypothetical protein n=1 Tax=Macrococcoides caseolyticum TaxID=69966 RepID=UPI001F47C1FB|nr:hypothetical protein [Macrococcus caseolyticus]MCE4956606.1 hypothetical protein [Macrococcus caseolyticus]